MDFKFDHGGSWSTEQIIAGLVVLFGRSPDRIEPCFAKHGERVAIWLYDTRNDIQHCSVWRASYCAVVQIDNTPETTGYRLVIGTWLSTLHH